MRGYYDCYEALQGMGECLLPCGAGGEDEGKRGADERYQERDAEAAARL